MKIEFGNWKEADWEFMRPGIMRTLFTGEGATVHFVEVQNGHEKKPHRHEYEQIVMILQGECDFHIGGEVYPMKPGGYAVIPPNVEHYIDVYNSKEPVINVDIFIPRRDEYVEQYAKFLKEKK